MADNRVSQPVGPSDRILALDVLRGFAMFGVLVAYCLWSLGTARAETYTSADKLIDAVAAFAVDGKMYTILAFLFGLGFSMQLGRTGGDSAPGRTYRRRLTVLAGIGLVHALLLRNGDILLPYALTGFLLIPFRRLSDGIVISAAVLSLLFPYFADAAWQASGVPLPERPHLAGAPYLVENAAWVWYWFQLAPFTWPTNLTLFLFGFLAGRRQLLSKLAGTRGTLGATVLGGALTGVIFYYFRLQLPTGDGVARAALVGLCYTFHCWGLAAFYTASLLLMLDTARGARALAPLAAIGRLALTNYLMQAALIVPLCLMFGWFDRFTPTTAILLALTVFGLVQLPFSLIWLRRYQYGPAEWLWRFLTYGHAPPLKAASDYAPV